MSVWVRYSGMIVCLFWMAGMVSAQDITRSWALRYVGSPLVKPVLTTNPSNYSTGRGSSAFSISGEYYLPKKWSVEAGYYRSEVSYGDADRTMEGLQSGVKKYLVNPDFFIQPYLTTALQVNWSSPLKEEGACWYEHTDFSGTKHYDITWNAKNPRISFAPGVGTEIYLLSPIAFVARYSFNMGLGSKTSVDVTSTSGEAYRIKDKGMYHQLELGVKITFPFRFTDKDGESLLNILQYWLDN